MDREHMAPWVVLIDCGTSLSMSEWRSLYASAGIDVSVVVVRADSVSEFGGYVLARADKIMSALHYGGRAHPAAGQVA